MILDAVRRLKKKSSSQSHPFDIATTHCQFTGLQLPVQTEMIVSPVENVQARDDHMFSISGKLDPNSGIDSEDYL
jgi:hypothetical protein